jgi:hypothetical protein
VCALAKSGALIVISPRIGTRLGHDSTSPDLIHDLSQTSESAVSWRLPRYPTRSISCKFCRSLWLCTSHEYQRYVYTRCRDIYLPLYTSLKLSRGTTGPRPGRSRRPMMGIIEGNESHRVLIAAHKSVCDLNSYSVLLGLCLHGLRCGTPKYSKVDSDT